MQKDTSFGGRFWKPDDLVIGQVFAPLVAAGVTAAAAQVSVPVLPVPVTLQTLAVMLCGLVLGVRGGVVSQLMYLAGGLAGLPIFANLQGGPAVLFGPTGGYLLAFPLLAAFCGWMSWKGWDKKVWTSVLGMVAGSSGLLAIGSLWLSLFLNQDLGQSFAVGFVPFFAIETIKALVAAGAMPLAWKLFPQK